MNIQQIAQKYRISDNFLNSKDDGYNIVIASLDELVKSLKQGIEAEETIKKLHKMREFMVDVRNATF
jgi:hypothetical protein